jgi:predicted RNA binding protein YcfA (HicA-like mRNA interferase family)
MASAKVSRRRKRPMVKPAKLYELLLQSASRSIAYRDFEKLVIAFGFKYVRMNGSHAIYTHPKLQRPFPIQPEGKDAKRYQVRELLELVEEYGLTLDA